MSSAVVYIINGNLNYRKMALNSIKMLRKFNKNIRILCFCTYNETVFPEELMVEIKYVKNIDPEYFPANTQGYPKKHARRAFSAETVSITPNHQLTPWPYPVQCVLQ